MPETPFLRGRAALPGPRLSVFIQFIIRAPSDQYHWVFCQTGFPTREKPHQHYHSEGIPDHVFPLSSNARAFCASSSRRHHSTRRPVYLNKGSHLPVSRYFNLLKAALFPLLPSLSVLLCKRLRYGKFQGVLTWGSPLYLGLEKKPDLLSGTQFPECPLGEVRRGPAGVRKT